MTRRELLTMAASATVVRGATEPAPPVVIGRASYSDRLEDKLTRMAPLEQYFIDAGWDPPVAQADSSSGELRAMPTFTLPVIPKLTVISVIDILAVAYLIYQFILIIRGRRAAHILSGLWILVVVYLIAVWREWNCLRSVLAALAPYTAIALIVMFQSEIRRLLARIGRSQWLGLGGQLERRELVDEIILALEQMVEVKTAR